MLPLDRFNAYNNQHTLFDPAKNVLLAVSGGRDSVLMAHLFKQAGVQFGIAHCNFNLREDEAQRDEAFVRLLAANFEVPVFVQQFDTKEYASAEKISTQMAARQLRYQWFETLRAAQHYESIAVAHHQNDAIETLLLNLVRGTGISGLHGILPKNGYIIRPMLFLTAAEIDELIVEHDIAYVEDSSNLNTYYTRNKIRHQVIPHLREINAALEQTFEQNIERFAATEQVLAQVVAQTKANICEEVQNGLRISIEGIKALYPQKLLLFELLKPYNFTALLNQEILDALDKQTGTSFYSATHRATIDRDEVLVTPIPADNNEVLLWHSTTETLVFKGQQIKLTVTGQLPWQFNPAHAYIDYEQLVFPLIVRSWQPGDSFMPLGMQTFKKMSDFFIDTKVPLPEKENIPLLINGNSQIIWVGGHRQDDRYKVTTSTKKVAIFELEN